MKSKEEVERRIPNKEDNQKIKRKLLLKGQFGFFIALAGDIVLDPFCGSGAACLAALRDKRHYIGYDIEREYIEIAEKRIKAYLTQSSQLNLYEQE